MSGKQVLPGFWRKAKVVSSHSSKIVEDTGKIGSGVPGICPWSVGRAALHSRNSNSSTVNNFPDVFIIFL